MLGNPIYDGTTTYKKSFFKVNSSGDVFHYKLKILNPVGTEIAFIAYLLKQSPVVRALRLHIVSKSNTIDEV